MATWIQSLSWTLIYSLGQGMVIYTALWLVLKLMPTSSAGVKYHLSLSALTVLFGWFLATWWQQYHLLVPVSGQSVGAILANAGTTKQLFSFGIIENHNNSNWLTTVKVFLPWLSAFYVIGLALMLVRLSVGMLQLFSFRKIGVSQPDAVVNGLLTSLKHRLHFDGQVRLFISAKAPVPMVIGFLKPIILLPAAIMAQLSMEQLETILLHELAHIKRYDYLVNILQTIVETILFFNPFVWMISGIVRREREHCCDDMVLDHTREPLFYATALAALSTSGTVSALTIAASGQSNHLFNRIKRIMEMKKNPFSYSRMIAAILIIAAITSYIAWLAPSFSRSESKKPVTLTQTKSVQEGPANAKVDETNQLIQQLTDDHLIDAANGFLIEKNQNRLYIDRKQQPDAIANKYLRTIKQEFIRVEVFPFRERIMQHPGVDMIQLVDPVRFSSPCVDYGRSNPKEGC